MGQKYGPYKVREVQTNKQVTYSIGLPKEVGAPLAGKKFLVEVTDGGLLFTPAPAHKPAVTDFAPSAEALALSEKFGNPGA